VRDDYRRSTGDKIRKTVAGSSAVSRANETAGVAAGFLQRLGWKKKKYSRARNYKEERKEQRSNEGSHLYRHLSKGENVKALPVVRRDRLQEENLGSAPRLRGKGSSPGVSERAKARTQRRVSACLN